MALSNKAGDVFCHADFVFAEPVILAADAWRAGLKSSQRCNGSAEPGQYRHA